MGACSFDIDCKTRPASNCVCWSITIWLSDPSALTTANVNTILRITRHVCNNSVFSIETVKNKRLSRAPGDPEPTSLAAGDLIRFFSVTRPCKPRFNKETISEPLKSLTSMHLCDVQQYESVLCRQMDNGTLLSEVKSRGKWSVKVKISDDEKWYRKGPRWTEELGRRRRRRGHGLFGGTAAIKVL